MEYNIEDFTLEKYSSFLTEVKDKFIFASFDMLPHKGRHILLRHDLDLSVSAAHKIAHIEYKQGVQATYFLLLHSPFYNLLDARNYGFVKDIIKMGHHIGLHFDSHFYNINSEDELNDKIIAEASFISNLFGLDLKVFSFHLTNAFTMNCKKQTYGGLINAYADFFQTNYEYCSDSYGLWRHKRLFDFVKDTKFERVQILTHPEWWVHEPAMPAIRIQNIINELSSELEKDADRNYIYKEAL